MMRYFFLKVGFGYRLSINCKTATINFNLFNFAKVIINLK